MQSRFVTHELPNGLRVVCEEMPNVRSAAAGFLVRTGARDEFPTQHGVSHFLEHMCFKGTPTRSSFDINVRFDELGAIYNAYTGKEHTVYYGWVPGARIDAQIELLADIMRPSLPEPDFQTERQVVLEEIAMNDDNFDRAVWNFVHETVYGTHSLGHEILGEKETIQNLPRQTMLDYHRTRYSPRNMWLFAAGALDAQEVFATAGRHCGTWERAALGPAPDGLPPPLPAGVRRLKLDRFTQQCLLLLYPSIPHGHADEETLEAFTAIFGGGNSRCYWNIVQKGICTEAGLAWIAYRDHGVLALYAQGEPERCDEMLAALRAQAAEITTGGVKPDEVQRVKNQRRTHLWLEAESPRTRMMQLVDDIEVHGRVRSAEVRLSAVEAVSAARIARYLRKYPITGDGLLLSCGPRDWP